MRQIITVSKQFTDVANTKGKWHQNKEKGIDDWNQLNLLNYIVVWGLALKKKKFYPRFLNWEIICI